MDCVDSVGFYVMFRPDFVDFGADVVLIWLQVMVTLVCFTG